MALESTVALLSLCAGVRPSRSSGSSSSSVPFGRDMTRRLGTPFSWISASVERRVEE